jgi:sugar lactone lactonase YvrE
MPTTWSENEPLHVVPVPAAGAEDVLVGDGVVYTGTEDGSVHAVAEDGKVRLVGSTGGRPLGLEWLPDGRLLVCDADRGLLAMDPADGRVETLVEEVAGSPMLLCDNAAVASDGTVYFSDSSTVHRLARWKADMVEDTHTGRLLRRHPDGRVEVLLDGLRFANGVALAADESFVCVAETTGRNVVRRWLSGPRAGEVDQLVTDLPGYPDNIARGTDGLIWVAIASPTDPVLERLVKAPLAVRRLVWRLPEAIQPKPRRTARVMAFDASGRRVHDRSFDASEFHVVTGVREHHGRVWLGTLVDPAIAWFDL